MSKIAILLAGLSFGACAERMLRPSPLIAAPLHHNIPATIQYKDFPDRSSIVWLCATQPRQYNFGPEEDHYIQDMPCPIDPIK